MSADQEGALLALPVVVCLLNLGAPYLFRCLAALERQDSPVLEVYLAICRYVAGWGGGRWPGAGPLFPGSPSLSAPRLLVLCRNLIFKMAILGILCYHWLGRRVGTLQDQVREAPGARRRGCSAARDGGAGPSPAGWVVCLARSGRGAGPLGGPPGWAGAGAAASPGAEAGLFQCWENFVGQELYRLTVLDFIFVLLDTLFGELVWR